MSVGMIDTCWFVVLVVLLLVVVVCVLFGGANPIGEGALQAKPATGAVDFQSALKSSLDQVNEVQLQSKKLADRFEMGDPSVSLTDAMISLQKSSIAFQNTVQVRNKLVYAYHEIMNMGI